MCLIPLRYRLMASSHRVRILALSLIDVPSHFPLGGGGRLGQLTNYCYFKIKVTENAMASSLAAWLTIDQLSGKFENITPHAPRPHIPATSVLSGELLVPLTVSSLMHKTTGLLHSKNCCEACNASDLLSLVLQLPRSSKMRGKQAIQILDTLSINYSNYFD